jgi:hypothetical protein
MDTARIDKREAAVTAQPLPESMPATCCPPFSRIDLPRGALLAWIGNRYVLTAIGLAIVGSGLALGWDWLTAIGVAPIIVSVAPCLIMCGLGVCMMCRRSPR